MGVVIAIVSSGFLPLSLCRVSLYRVRKGIHIVIETQASDGIQHRQKKEDMFRHLVAGISQIPAELSPVSLK
jgi:hypothetical protein